MRKPALQAIDRVNLLTCLFILMYFPSAYRVCLQLFRPLLSAGKRGSIGGDDFARHVLLSEALRRFRVFTDEGILFVAPIAGE